MQHEDPWNEFEGEAKRVKESDTEVLKRERGSLWKKIEAEQPYLIYYIHIQPSHKFNPPKKKYSQHCHPHHNFDLLTQPTKVNGKPSFGSALVAQRKTLLLSTIPKPKSRKSSSDGQSKDFAKSANGKDKVQPHSRYQRSLTPLQAHSFPSALA